MGDWFGLANATEMLTPVMIREVVVEQNLKQLAKAASDARSKDRSTMCKIFCLLAYLKDVTMYASRWTIAVCFLITPRLRKLQAYRLSQALGGMAFIVK